MRSYYVIPAIITFCFLPILILSQNGMQATFGTTINTLCNGNNCNYSGPSILINELMISPSSNDGSLSGPSGTNPGRGEWIELYNPNLCEPIDISCYFLGNSTEYSTNPFLGTTNRSGGFIIPQGTIVPAGGFCLLRGENAAAVPSNLLVQNGGNVVEIVVPGAVNGTGVCVASGETRLWFPNAGGWFAFYDSNGVPQDAVSWGNQAGIAGFPCIPTRAGCNASVTSLSSYNDIPANRKNRATSQDASNHLGNSIRRMPDGAAWSGTGTPTYATCNDVCIPPSSSTCDGTATINVTGGTAPYSYSWNDSQAQLTQTAVGLCAGTYTCTVTDGSGDTQSFQVEIVDFVPAVTMSVIDEICIDGGAVSLAGTPQPTGGANGVFTGAGVSGTTFNPAVAQAGPHTLTYTYTDENGCQNSATDNITVNPLPVVSITNVANPYCVEVQSANLQLSPSGGQLSGTGVSSNQFSPSAAGVGTYTLTYEYTDANGCENSTTASVQVTQAAPPTITAPAQLCVDANAVTIQVNPSGGQFQVNGSNASLSFLPLNYGVGVHTLSYSYSDANNCVGMTSETINVSELPVITLGLNSVYCYESGFVSVNPQPAGGTFTGDNVVGGGLNIMSVNPGTYNVHYEVTDAFGCYAEQAGTYTVSTPFNPGFEYEVDCFQQFTGAASPVNTNYKYNWNFGAFETNAPALFTNYFTEFGTYVLTLTITDQHGCMYDTVGIVDVPKGIVPSDFTVPNVITPNGDGVNDYLAMPVALDECFTYKILITNRWGNVVFEMDNQAAIFDGRNKNGNELTEGVYFYQVVSDDFDCNDPELKGFCSGFITIVR